MAVAQIQIRPGTTAEWAAASPVVLAAGEQGYDTTLKRFKMGDGTTAFSALEWNTLLPYPVGAIYMSVVSTSPATLFGGTWAAWGAGRVPVGIDAGQTEFDTVEETGGANTVTLTEAEMPIHDHDFLLSSAGSLAGLAGSSTGDGNPVNVANVFAKVGNAGSGQAHNNLQPYIVCYMWRRNA